MIIKTVQLTTNEKEIIRTIARIQMQSCRSILRNECADDTLLFCLQSDISLDELNRVTREDLKAFKGVYKNPNTFLAIHPKYLSTFTHILFNFIPINGDSKGVFRKITLSQNFSIHNLN